MKSILQKGSLQRLKEEKNGYLFLSGLLGAISLVLSLLCFRLVSHEKIVLVPPEINKTFWVSEKAVSAEYLIEMTAYLAWLRLNITHDSATYQQSILLRRVDPRAYGTLKNALTQEHESAAAQHLSTAFYTASIVPNVEKLTVDITGDLQSMLGNTALPLQRVTYQIQYVYRNAQLWITSFKEIKKDAL